MARNLVAAKNQSKGKNFLVNDTFVRVDGVDWLNIQAHVGRLKPLHITTGNGVDRIEYPFCEGYVVSESWDRILRPTLSHRCMNEKELVEARKDHHFVRQQRFLFDTLWIEYSHKKDSFGETYANAHLQAFNAALHEKRQKIAKENPNIAFDELARRTYQDEPNKSFPAR
ncbi:hypothetical protein HDE_04036 [Halotydeus destructor]|nr:hypothetical protein HDE_04036 [Halotydeus destructor]